MPKHKKKRKWMILGPLLAFVLLISLIVGTQVFAHRQPYFTPDYPQLDLTELLSAPSRSKEDDQTIFLQTGLGKPAVDALLAQGDEGILQILDTQEAYFRPPQISCSTMGFFTREDQQVDGEKHPIYGFPMAPREQGDVFLSFSTHTMGWRHGHAGLVVETLYGSTLEAALMGTDSVVTDANRWSCYSTFLHLRLKEITPKQQQEIAQFALTHMSGIPYQLTSGVFGEEKAPDPDENLGAQCAYLVWYALFQAGYDTDGDGGRIVTVLDLAQSPLFEVVQSYGINPAFLFPEKS